ncbi:MAG TPA: hypothetical protein VI755_10375 [Anaerolineales bacterium]|nr:hypothetical protein [Anaerolineales bacterium]
MHDTAHWMTKLLPSKLYGGYGPLRPCHAAADAAAHAGRGAASSVTGQEHIQGPG